jgi:type VI protein secretion system component VasK
VTQLPWDYLWLPFSQTLFPDIYFPTLGAALILVTILIVLYNVRTRALHRHRPYTDMWEWLLWSGLITFLLLTMSTIFLFDFAVVLVIELVGIGTMLWVRFRRYPPLFAAYEQQLARQRYLSRQKAARPEATIRSRGSRRRRR